MGLLHNEKWRELGPEFEAADLVRKAHELLEGTGSETAARVRYYTENALRVFHPIVNNEDARIEYEQRKAGTYREGGQPQQSGRRTATPAEVEAENAQLRARLAELEAARTNTNNTPNT